MSAEVVFQKPNTLVLTGKVTAENVVAIRKKGDSIIGKITEKGVVDLSELASASTITLSLLLSWLRLARRKNVSLTISRPSGALFDMIRVSGLELVFPFETVDPVL